MTATACPADWNKVIDQESETCNWFDADGESRPGTEENTKVRRTRAALDHRQHDH